MLELSFIKQEPFNKINEILLIKLKNSSETLFAKYTHNNTFVSICTGKIYTQRQVFGWRQPPNFINNVQEISSNIFSSISLLNEITYQKHLNLNQKNGI